MNGPFVVNIKVHVTDGKQVAEATFRAPVGKWPTKEIVKEAMTKVEQQVRDQLGKKWRLCNPEEFLNNVLREEADVPAGMTFAGPSEWAP